MAGLGSQELCRMVLESLLVAVCAVDRKGKVTNQIAMEGHTDSRQYPADASYGNWELSADRTNAARRLMQTSGIRQDQVIQVRGFADQRLRKPETPLDPSNRRISLIVQYLDKKPSPDTAGGEKAEGEGGEEAKAGEAGEKRKE